MTNAYTDLTTVKSTSYLNLGTSTDYDTELVGLMEDASRRIDKYCNRFFYCWEGTKYYDGASPLQVDDLLSVTTLESDEDADAVFENILVQTGTTADFLLYPLNDYPKTKIELTAVATCGLANGVQKGVGITGIFGFGDEISATPYRDSGDTVQATMTTTQSTVGVATGGNFSAGQTIRIDSEQCYIESISSNTLTVKRAVNGVTVATHASATPIYIYEYPQPITQGCLITTMRTFKRKDSAFEDVTGNPITGQMYVYKGLDPDVAEIVKQYRRWKY